MNGHLGSSDGRCRVVAPRPAPCGSAGSGPCRGGRSCHGGVRRGPVALGHLGGQPPPTVAGHHAPGAARDVRGLSDAAYGRPAGRDPETRRRGGCVRRAHLRGDRDRRLGPGPTRREGARGRPARTNRQSIHGDSRQGPYGLGRGVPALHPVLDRVARARLAGARERASRLRAGGGPQRREGVEGHGRGSRRARARPAASGRVGRAGALARVPRRPPERVRREP